MTKYKLSFQININLLNEKLNLPKNIHMTKNTDSS